MTKTTIVLHDDTHALLKKLAFLRGTSISELLREAAIRCYGDCGPEIVERERAWKERLSRLFQPAGDGASSAESSTDTGS